MMSNPKIFFTVFFSSCILIVVLTISITEIVFSKNPEDCEHGAMSCFEVRKDRYGNLRYGECDKVYCRELPQEDKHWDFLPQQKQTSALE